MRFLYLIHDPSWTTSRVTDLLVERGHTVDYLCHQEGEPLPPVESLVAERCGLIIGGGFISTHAAAEQPFMARQIAFTRAVADAGLPVFGICLGAQILAAAYGAESAQRSDRRAEFGFWPVAATAEGTDLFDRTTMVYQVHDEGLTRLPDGGVLLASSDSFPIQAFRVGQRAYGVQFHPDAYGNAVESWWHDNQRLHNRVGAQSLPEQLDLAGRLEPNRISWLNRFLDHWLDDDRPITEHVTTYSTTHTRHYRGFN